MTTFVVKTQDEMVCTSPNAVLDLMIFLAGHHVKQIYVFVKEDV